LQLICSYTAVTGEFVIGVNIQAKINGQFKTIARFNTPSLPLNASLTDDGNYLKDRVTLTNPTTISTDFAVMQFSEIACEDETEYMCNVAYTGSSGSATENSGVTNISVKDSVRNVKVTTFPSSPTFSEGSGPITLTCTSDGNPAVTDYTWHKESNTRVSLGTGPTYVINNVVVNETDNYICVVSIYNPLTQNPHTQWRERERERGVPPVDIRDNNPNEHF
ncbi:hypothetical protein AM593_06995, partial [Mytilus galloprovincialis]